MSMPQPQQRLEAEDEDDNPLDFIRPRETLRAIKARGPQRAVSIFRFSLPLLAVLVLGTLILWPLINPRIIPVALLKNIPDLVIDNLHFTGLDAKNQPYSLSAAKATRPSGTKNIYDLDKPQGELTLEGGSWLASSAQVGRFDQDTRKLWLGGNVQVFHDQGYQFTSDEAQVDLKTYQAWGEKPVLIQGNFGEIRGNGFRLLENGKIMVVNGPAKAILKVIETTPAKPASP